MTTSSPVALTGPLAPAADGFHQELERLGHGPRSHRRQECLLADLSLWMDERGGQPRALTSRAIAAYLEERRRSGLRLVTQVGARPLLQYLRLGGVIPDAYRDAPAGPLGALLERYHPSAAPEQASVPLRVGALLAGAPLLGMHAGVGEQLVDVDGRDQQAFHDDGATLNLMAATLQRTPGRDRPRWRGQRASGGERSPGGWRGG
jgi:hypothetical protein